MRSRSITSAKAAKYGRSDSGHLPIADFDYPSSRDSVVPRYLVHRTALSEIFLTSAVAIDQDLFGVDGQWPRRHFYYEVDGGRIDPMLVAETLRQATIFIAHSFYSVPLQQRFLMDGIRFDLLATPLPLASPPQDIRMIVRVHGIRRNLSGVVALRTQVDFLANGITFARGHGDLQLVEPRVYERVRSRSNQRSTPSGLPPVSLGAHSLGAVIVPREVSTQQSAPSWTASVDPSHPVFFDHPVDHLPGMLVLELMRQVARAATGYADCDIVSLNGQFSRFIELDQTVLLELVEIIQLSERAWSLSIAAVQADSAAVTATLVASR